MDEKRKNQIRDGLQKTREKRKYQVCKVFELKIDKSRLNREQRESLKMLFVEAKWFYNFILSQKDPFKYDYKKVDIVSLDKDWHKIKREITHLGSSLRVSLTQQIQDAIVALNKSKKKGK